MNGKRIATNDLVAMALMAAATSVMAQLQIPMPLGVPMTLQTLAVTIAGVYLGGKRGCISMLIYVAMGAIGLPVFAGFRGGPQMLLGPTGGFLLSFPLMAFLIGLGSELREEATKSCPDDGRSFLLKHGELSFVVMLILGTSINYMVGMIVFMLVTGSGPWAAFMGCVLPFIPTTIIKAIAGAWLGLTLRRRIPAR